MNEVENIAKCPLCGGLNDRTQVTCDDCGSALFDDEDNPTCPKCGGCGEVMCPGYAGRGCGPGEDQFGRLCRICDGAAMVACPDCAEELFIVAHSVTARPGESAVLTMSVGGPI